MQLFAGQELGLKVAGCMLARLVIYSGSDENDAIAQQIAKQISTILHFEFWSAGYWAGVPAENQFGTQVAPVDPLPTAQKVR